MTDKPKKFRFIKKVYFKVEDTYSEDFEMTQDKWTELYEYAERNGDGDIIKDLPKEMTTNKKDWEKLYSLCMNSDIQNIDEKTDVLELHDDEFSEVIEVKD